MASAVAGNDPIGFYSAAVLLAEIGDNHRFTSKRQLYSYVGLVPVLCKNSVHASKPDPVNTHQPLGPTFRVSAFFSILTIHPL